ncbi:hypothetical protein J2741_002371 [Methanolinea mesophila]|uniref:hypothetical protein n=1 Tax=Methanolinea mesophila TaxID=547055 RepID=UPI001AE57C58|nr:hypothetical protein [Methanolinea mesophila]MBP1929775.1 hypothetical protein [Methanolinea mesophila]
MTDSEGGEKRKKKMVVLSALSIVLVVFLGISISGFFPFIGASQTAGENISMTGTSRAPVPLFEDTFDNGLSGWQRYGYPLPEVRADMGNPPPSFDCRGDDLYDSFAISHERFNLSGGIIYQVDMYANDTRSEGCWVDAFFRIPRYPEGADALIQIVLRPIGPACWGEAPQEIGHGVYDFFITNESDTYEHLQVIGGPADADVGAWHRYTIVVLPDRHVEFYRDGELLHRPEGTLSANYSAVPLPVYIGARSYIDYGPSLIDNVRVYPYSQLDMVMNQSLP